MKKTLFYIALLGSIIAITVHIFAVLGVDVADTLPFIWVLHIGIFVVWIPTILSLKEQQKENKEANAFTILTKDKPKWIIAVIIGIAIYTGLNFMLFMSKAIEGTPLEKNGVYSLHNRGTHIRDITKEEYHLHGANILRGFSGHWILFYTVAAIALYKPKQEDEK